MKSNIRPLFVAIAPGHTLFASTELLRTTNTEQSTFGQTDVTMGESTPAHGSGQGSNPSTQEGPEHAPPALPEGW